MFSTVRTFPGFTQENQNMLHSHMQTCDFTGMKKSV